ncbi:MAG TPA: sigma-54 dependent transcriptional regulator [Candidatus Acidoferrum sp.]|nr:sigma-54 dependent transcriptional regulator [Candidatus Acidoferrum sp.]
MPRETKEKEITRDVAHILVVDDERSICELLEITFRKEGHRVEVANTVEAAKRKLESQIFDIVISDVRMPGADGLELLKFVKEVSPTSFFLLITGVPTVETAIAAINAGADRYVIKDHDLVDQLRRAVGGVAENLKLRKEAGYLRRELRRLTGLDNILGQSPKMRAIFELIQTIAPQSSRVLITGESGTGKELVARAIHENSQRSQAPFITINCGAFPETLLESELFGYMKGSFTGANENRQGLFQAAHGGTLFMDEIGNMSLTMQVKLYRVLQEGKVRPIGSNEEIDVDVRVIAATNKDFEKEIAEGRFREDLYYRLSVIPIQLPPLSDRREDIALLARHFIERFRKSMDKPIVGISAEALRRLEAYDWPGNVRELENTIERAIALESGPEITLGSLPDRIAGYAGSSNAANDNGHSASFPEAGVNFEEEIADAERRYIAGALEKSEGVRTKAAELLHISYRSFRHYAKKHNLIDNSERCRAAAASLFSDEHDALRIVKNFLESWIALQ